MNNDYHKWGGCGGYTHCRHVVLVSMHVLNKCNVMSNKATIQPIFMCAIFCVCALFGIQILFNDQCTREVE